MYQVGRAQAPEPNDPKFEELAPALNEAQAQNEDAPDTVIAVWRLYEKGQSTEAHYLVYQGVLFWSASGPH